MSKDNIIKLIQPGNVDDQLTEILRTGARALLAQAVEAEVADFIDKHADLKTTDGHQRVVRHGKGGRLPEQVSARLPVDFVKALLNHNDKGMTGICARDILRSNLAGYVSLVYRSAPFIPGRPPRHRN